MSPLTSHPFYIGGVEIHRQSLRASSTLFLYCHLFSMCKVIVGGYLERACSKKGEGSTSVLANERNVDWNNECKYYVNVAMVVLGITKTLST